MVTFTYTKPTIGGSEDTWGDTLNANWDAIAAFIGPLDSTELAVLDGITASTAELNLLDGVTASTAELNLLDGVTATTAEINYLDGVTSAIQDQIDNIPTPPELTQVQVEDDTSTVFGQVSGERLAQAVAANVDVATAIAALPLNGVGTYAMLCRTLIGDDGDVTKGDTYAGSSLFFLGPLGRTSSTNNGYYGRVHTSGLSGTWMATGTHSSNPIDSNNFYQGQLWLRIA
jgi:hypothetical protein